MCPAATPDANGELDVLRNQTGVAAGTTGVVEIITAGRP
jgi:hypothetical protein